MLTFLKNWTLPLAMLIGMAGYPLFSSLMFLTPYLIFAMLLLTFSRVSPAELKPGWLHMWLILIQLIGAPVAYLLLAPVDKVVAQGVMLCMLCPTATAAAVITSRLGGSAASVTAYTLLANVGAALAVPLFFPLVEVQPDADFATAFLFILGRIFPLLICPFLVAMLLRSRWPVLHGRLLRLHSLAFYLWALSLTIVTAQTFASLLHTPSHGGVELWVVTGASVACCLQFFLGKRIGSCYGDRIAGGQALGQKNTILAIWMAHTYLHPLAAVAPGSYVLWQNIINSYQLWKRAKAQQG